MANKYPTYANSDDRRCAAQLISMILASDTGITVSIDCGEEFTIKNSDNKLDILKEMGATGEDFVIVKKDGVKLGWFYLIFCNGSEGDPMILISNYSSNVYCDSIWNALNEKLG